MTTFRHLQIFVTVADCGTMRKAAELLYISQPSVSQAIQELEETYQVRLFDRLNRHIYITEAGKKLLSYARPILQSMEAMEEAMHKVHIHPILRIGGSVTVGTCYLNSFIQQLERKINGIDIRVTVDNTAHIENLVLNSQLDFAIVEGIVSHEDLIQKKVHQDEIVMVVGKSHPFFGASSLTLKELDGESLLSRESGSTDRNQFELLLAENNVHMIRKWCCTNTEALKQAAILGQGIAILSKDLVQKEQKENTLRILPLEGVHVTRDYKLIYHKNKLLPSEILDTQTF